MHLPQNHNNIWEKNWKKIQLLKFFNKETNSLSYGFCKTWFILSLLQDIVWLFWVLNSEKRLAYKICVHWVEISLNPVKKNLKSIYKSVSYALLLVIMPHFVQETKREGVRVRERERGETTNPFNDKIIVLVSPELLSTENILAHYKPAEGCIN